MNKKKCCVCLEYYSVTRLLDCNHVCCDACLMTTAANYCASLGETFIGVPPKFPCPSGECHNSYTWGIIFYSTLHQRIFSFKDYLEELMLDDSHLDSGGSVIDPPLPPRAYAEYGWLLLHDVDRALHLDLSDRVSCFVCSASFSLSCASADEQRHMLVDRHEMSCPLRMCEKSSRGRIYSYWELYDSNGPFSQFFEH